MNTNQEAAKCLLSHGYNAAELAEALQVTRQSALAIMRTIGSPARSRPRRAGWNWTDRFSRTQAWSLDMESRCER